MEIQESNSLLNTQLFLPAQEGLFYCFYALANEKNSGVLLPGLQGSAAVAIHNKSKQKSSGIEMTKALDHIFLLNAPVSAREVLFIPVELTMV